MLFKFNGKYPHSISAMWKTFNGFVDKLDKKQAENGDYSHIFTKKVIKWINHK